MLYDIRVVEDTALPEGHDWTLLEYDGRITFVVKRSAQGLQAMAEGWAAYRRAERGRRDRAPVRPGLRVVV